MGCKVSMEQPELPQARIRSDPRQRLQSAALPTPPSDGLRLCTVCKRIPFSQLPSEEEPGLPHHPSFAALQRSARTCDLCRFLTEALNSVQRKIQIAAGHTPTAQGASQDDFWIAAYIPYTYADSSTGMEIMHYGRQRPSINDDIEMDLDRTPRPNDNASTSTAGAGRTQAVYRPYIFGSWWRLRGSQSPDQLVGLGVRLGRTPNLVDALGNSRECQVLHGTHLRLRVPDGRFLLE